MRPGKIYRDSLANERPWFVKTTISALVPFVMVYGVYILFNGALSPGGGFSAGTILGAGLVLASVSLGPKTVRRFFSFKTSSIFLVVSLGIYVLLKAYSFAMYNLDLPTGIPKGTEGNLISGGTILPLNISIGIVVACTIYSFYALFSDGEV